MPIPLAEQLAGAGASPDGETRPCAPTVSDELIVYLQRHNNPFDDYVHPQGVSKRLNSTHVVSVNDDVAATLLAAVDQYRLNWQEAQAGKELDVLWSGVIVVFGKRGEGKTHLLHHELASAEAVVVAPTEFETYRPFREYLLVQLIARLQRDPPHRSDLVNLAQWFTRRLLIHAITSLSEIEWVSLCQSHDDRSDWLPLTSKTSRHWEHERVQLLEELENGAPQPIRDLCLTQEQSTNFLYQLALGHVQRTEPDRTAAQQLRARLYAEFVEIAFDPKRTEIFDILLGSADGLPADGTSPVSRSTLVDERLSCLVEMFVLYGRPIVFAFDGLELLLQDPPDKQRCQAFHNGIAQLIDIRPGIPFFIFAEEGHWQHSAKHFGNYASQRFERGIPVPGRGAINRLDLKPIDTEGLIEIVAARLRPLLEDSPIGKGLAGDQRIRPFQTEDLSGVLQARHGAGNDAPSLRVILQQLQKQYENLVFNRNPLVVGPAPADVESDLRISSDELEALWERETSKAERAIARTTLVSSAAAIYQGVRNWLECLIADGISLDGWVPMSGENVTFGNELRYGECIRCRWEQDRREHRHGLAFFLAGGRGMPMDLSAKLSMMQSADRVADSLLVLWPRAEAIEPAHESLPAATAEVWNNFSKSKQASRLKLQSIEATQIAPWLALAGFRRLAVEERSISLDVFAHFVNEKMASYRRYVTPFSTEETS